jgi:hypothetical protein
MTDHDQRLSSSFQFRQQLVKSGSWSAAHSSKR